MIGPSVPVRISAFAGKGLGLSGARRMVFCALGADKIGKRHPSGFRNRRIIAFEKCGRAGVTQTVALI